MKLPPDPIKKKSLAPPFSGTTSKPFNSDSLKDSLRTDTADSSKEAIAKKKRVRVSHTAGTNYRTTRELAERWPVSIRTLENWRARGVGPKRKKFGFKVVYHIDEIEAYEAVHYPNLRAS